MRLSPGNVKKNKKLSFSFAFRSLIRTFAGMKHVMMIVVASALLMATGCQEKHDVGAAELLEEIKQLFKQGQYAATLDSIESLRMHFPKAIHERQEALRIWQEASLKMAQQDIALTDSALQAVTDQMQTETRIYERNMLGVKKDSLQARYEALIGVVRMIRKRMNEIQQ